MSKGRVQEPAYHFASERFAPLAHLKHRQIWPLAPRLGVFSKLPIGIRHEIIVVGRGRYAAYGVMRPSEQKGGATGAPVERMIRRGEFGAA